MKTAFHKCYFSRPKHICHNLYNWKKRNKQAGTLGCCLSKDNHAYPGLSQGNLQAYKSSFKSHCLNSWWLSLHLTPTNQATHLGNLIPLAFERETGKVFNSSKAKQDIGTITTRCWQISTRISRLITSFITRCFYRHTSGHFIGQDRLPLPTPLRKAA